MEKIYLVESRLVYDYELCRSAKFAFKSEENAKREYEEQKSAIKKELDDEEGWEVEETKTSYETYLEGYYSQSHACVTITEMPLNE